MNIIAIVGGGGFIGTNLSEFLLSHGMKVKAIGSSFFRNFEDENYQQITLDVNILNELLDALRDCSTVIWLVNATVPGSNASLAEEFMLNTQPVIRFLEQSSRSIQMKKFIYLSSGGTVYGDVAQRIPIPEETSEYPISTYGLSKLITENYVDFLTRISGFESYILRPANVYGPYQNLNKPQGIIGFAFRAVKENGLLDLYNGGKVIRDFVYVDDLSDAILKCITQIKHPGAVTKYNVGSGEARSIKEIVDEISRIAKKPISLNEKLSRNFDCAYNVLSIDKIHRETGWKPTTKLTDGLLKVEQWINRID
ncbi:NAD-dependent epimerase/dehydratase family protein [Chryseobacterium lacus]|uniref:NAD-dependent epimerase/dehydratase family protein n=1 Tax=Chryseobacterium lacus TaxID=2058346 RepID=A0A368MXM4_9FLAO|nr:NAD-dependent epimerase/dehydratase family protein [Chryseobacterium lacus]RCU42972.1 NAD-dependent epimerase/dehydratase family protein [Chryseobacterium lacus]RST27822.1 NAD-dependent epimerase/dehydratase family protein [Chryseobacterium lacus]